LREVGKFHPRLLPHYLSDYEFTIRAHRKGLKLITSADIAVKLDREQTGIRSLEDLGFIDFIKRLFSKKYGCNPIYWSTFILLAVSKSHIPLLLLKLWIGTAKMFFYRGLRSLRNQSGKTHI
jgi:GT2 family glycosyltransferase